MESLSVARQPGAPMAAHRCVIKSPSVRPRQPSNAADAEAPVLKISAAAAAAALPLARPAPHARASSIIKRRKVKRRDGQG
ncbi:hypothetical protein E2C01_091058 [Portunus trituberculatus]|uniref:Uncharacterized protein n=1 Tax=Portunus trituberculatus TaxID=210409 RepID=A0A5B7JGD6_PORTR|nr:hypothetical protein [Portunus trituberculatus]